MSNTMFQAAVGGFPSVGSGFRGVHPRRGFAGLADVSSDNAIILAAQNAIALAGQYPQIFNSAPPSGGWTTDNPGLASATYNLSNQLAAGRAEGWGANYYDEIRQRTATVLRYLPSGETPPQYPIDPNPTQIPGPPILADPANLVPMPPQTPSVSAAPVVTVTPAPQDSGGLPALGGTISLPVVGQVSTKTALLVGAGIAAYFLFMK